MLGYATALHEKGLERDRSRVEELLEEARNISIDLGMSPLRSRVDTLMSGLGPPASTAYPDGLTEREVGVLRLICDGKTDREIGEALYISFRTVGNHVRSILNKTAAANRTEAASYANRQGLAG